MDFELSDGVRLLAATLGAPTEKATLYTLRIWLDYARQRSAWRPMRTEGDLTTAPLAQLMEQACGWAGDPGRLIGAMIECGILVEEVQGEVRGLRCPLFEEANEHLILGTRHARAGRASALKRRLRAAEADGKMSSRLGVAQGAFVLEDFKEEDHRDAAGLLAQIAVACEQSVPTPAELKDKHTLLRAALQVRRQHSDEQIGWVLQYLQKNIKNPAVSKEPEIILRDWTKYLRYSTPTHFSA